MDKLLASKTPVLISFSGSSWSSLSLPLLWVGFWHQVGTEARIDFAGINKHQILSAKRDKSKVETDSSLIQRTLRALMVVAYEGYVTFHQCPLTVSFCEPKSVGGFTSTVSADSLEQILSIG